MNSLTRRHLIISSILLLLFNAPLNAGIYKWTDQNGQVHYGERPGNTSAERVTIRTNETTKPRTIKTTEDSENKDDSEEGEDTQVKPKPEIFKQPEMSATEKRKLCKQTKDYITKINSRGRMREINAKGEYIYLPDEQKKKRLADANKRKRKYCR